MARSFQYHKSFMGDLKFKKIEGLKDFEINVIFELTTELNNPKLIKVTGICKLRDTENKEVFLELIVDSIFDSNNEDAELSFGKLEESEAFELSETCAGEASLIISNILSRAYGKPMIIPLKRG